MARKKQEVALQLEINTQEEWEELMQRDGLLIVDVYQDWCGPCKAVLSFLRRMKNEIGDDLLLFAIAKSDTIDSLEKYRGRCEPCFLIYGGGALVSVIRGANPPELEVTIKNKLDEEHKVMKGEIERKEMKDPYFADMDIEEKEVKSDKDIEEIEQEVTLALIKPDVVKAGKVDEIISKIKERGIDILAKEERNLSEEEARSFYHHMEDSEYFENLIKFITSGPSFLLVLAKGDEGIIHEFRELIGPKVYEEAKEQAPDSFRATYGSSSIENAIHGADDKESAQRELAFFFPDFVAPKISRKKQEVSHQQRTLALIRPAAFAEFKESILEKIQAAGFKIAMQKEVKLNKVDAELFYKEHKSKPYFEDLTTEMSNGTLLALALEKQNAISGFRGILGPKDVEQAKENDPSSLRAQFSKEDIAINLIHGSDSEETAQNELKYFFPIEHTIAAIKPDGIENREEIINKILEAQFHIVKTLDIVLTKELAEEFYSDQKEEEYFEDLITHMQSGPTLFMILSREDAIRGWRSIMGPKDPNIAAESYPDSIRSVYGKDIKENAVFGSADEKEVIRIMDIIFGKLKFNEDGSLENDAEESKNEAADEEPEVTGEDSSSQDNHQMDSTGDKKADDEDDTLTKDNDHKESDEPEVAEFSTVEDPKEMTETENEDNKETILEEAGTTEVEIEQETGEKTEIIEQNGENPSGINEETEKNVSYSQDDDKVEHISSEDNEEKIDESKIEGETEKDVSHDDDKVEHISSEGTEEKVDESKIGEENEKDVSHSQDDNKVEHISSEGKEEKVDESKIDESDVNVEDERKENTVEESQEQNELTEAEGTIVSEQNEETHVEETDISKEEDDAKVEETVVSERQEEHTVAEETLVSKEEEKTEENKKEDETLFEEVDLGSKSEEHMNEETVTENVVEENVTENNVAEDVAGEETSHAEDLDNAGTESAAVDQ